MNLFPQTASLPRSLTQVNERLDQLRFGNRLRQDSSTARQMNALIATIQDFRRSFPGRCPTTCKKRVDKANAYKLVKLIEISLTADAVTDDPRQLSRFFTRRHCSAPRRRSPDRAFRTAPRLHTANSPPDKEPSMPSHNFALGLCRHVRSDDRRPRAPRRHRSHHRGGEGFHHLRRGGEIRRRQGDPRRHGAEPDHQPAGRGRHRHHQRADPRSLGDRQGRRRHEGRKDRRDRQGRQSRHPAGRHHHHRPRHRGDRRRGQDPHRRRLRHATSISSARSRSTTR